MTARRNVWRAPMQPPSAPTRSMPNLPEGHRARGYYYYWGQRNFELALSEFSLAAHGRPNDPQIFASIGLVLRRQGRWQEAIDALQRAADGARKSRHRSRPRVDPFPRAAIRRCGRNLPQGHRAGPGRHLSLRLSRPDPDVERWRRSKAREKSSTPCLKRIPPSRASTDTSRRCSNGTSTVPMDSLAAVDDVISDPIGDVRFHEISRRVRVPYSRSTSTGRLASPVSLLESTWNGHGRIPPVTRRSTPPSVGPMPSREKRKWRSKPGDVRSSCHRSPPMPFPATAISSCWPGSTRGSTNRISQSRRSTPR